MSARWADLFGADPNFTLGMDTDRYLTHNRGECPDDMPCALCLLARAEADLRERLAAAIEAAAKLPGADEFYGTVAEGLHAAARIVRERP